MIRRIILDGTQLPVTRENVAIALSFADHLAAQIFAGKTYDPAGALQHAKPAAANGDAFTSRHRYLFVPRLQAVHEAAFS